MRKSKKLTIGFAISSVLLIIAFFVLFAISRNIYADYKQYNDALIAAEAAVVKDEALIAELRAKANAVNSTYTLVSFFTWVDSILAIVSVGLGLKLIDSAKEKEEEFDNHFVFEDKGGADPDKPAAASGK